MGNFVSVTDDGGGIPFVQCSRLLDQEKRNRRSEYDRPEGDLAGSP